MRYIEYVLGPPGNRMSTIVPEADLPRLVKIARNNNQPLFRSLYTYDEEVVQWVNSHNGSISGFPGKVALDRMIFDIDKGDHTDEEVHYNAKHFVEHLQEVMELPTANIRPMFSGRGFHIVTSNIFGLPASSDLPAQITKLVNQYFPMADPIYDRTRIIRVGNTISEKSGFYKIPLSPEELFSLTMEEILEKAKLPRLDFKYPPEEPWSPADLQLKTLESEEDPKEPGVAAETVVTVKGISQPSAIVTCAQKMFDQGPVKGRRHHTMLRIASAWRRAGIPQEAIVSSLFSWVGNGELTRTEVGKIVGWAFSARGENGCNDELNAKFCSSECIHFKEKNFGPRAMSAKAMEMDFVKFIRTDFSESSFDLSHLYSLHQPFKVYPQEFVVVTGDTGLGKTAWVQQVISNLRQLSVLVLTLEVGQNLYFRRQVQIAHKMTKKAVLEHYAVNNNHLSNALSHIRVIEVAPALDKMKRIIADIRPQVVVIDTLDGLIVESAIGETDHTRKVSIALKQLAVETNTIIIGVHHITKSSVTDQEGNRKALTVHSLKGSSAIEQKADKVIAIEGERLELNEGDDPAAFDNVLQPRTIRSLKSRDEDPFLIYAGFDPSTFTFNQIPRPEWKTLNEQIKVLRNQTGEVSATS